MYKNCASEEFASANGALNGNFLTDWLQFLFRNWHCFRKRCRGGSFLVGQLPQFFWYRGVTGFLPLHWIQGLEVRHDLRYRGILGHLE